MKAFLRIALINLGVFLTAIIIAELIFGDWISGPSYGLMNLPRNERRLLDVSKFVPGSQLIRYTRDEYGLRGDYGGDPAKIDVLALGGSTTDERYISDDDTWVAQLHNQFRTHGRPLTIVNAAIDGQSSVGHINALTQWLAKIPRLHPKYLIFYLGINDVAVDDATPTSFDQITSPSRSRRIRQYVINHSALYNLYRTVRGMIRADRAQLMHGRLTRTLAQWLPVTDHHDIQDVRHGNEAFLTAFGERLKTLAALARKFGAEPIFVTQTRGDYKEENGQSYVLTLTRDGQPPSSVSDEAIFKLTLFNEVTLTKCAELKLTCVDLASSIDFVDEDFYDAIHTTQKGSKKIGEFLYGALADKISK